MRLPHERYIRFLITSGLDLEETNEHLQDKGLPPCPVDDEQSEYWDQQYSILFESSVPKSIKAFWESAEKKKFPEGFFEYMNTLGLKEAWAYNVGKSRYFTIAVDALEDEDICIGIRCLLTLRAAPEEISAIINSKFGMVLPKESVTLFKEYFYDPRIMSRRSWRHYLRAVPSEHRNLLYKAISGREVELRAELDYPNKISVADHYQKLHIYAMEKFNTYRTSSGPNADQHAIKWAGIAMSAGDKYEKLKLGDTADFSKDIQMEFAFVDTDFAMIGEENLEEIQKANEMSENENDEK